MCEYRRDRSKFWMKIFIEEKLVKICANAMVRKLLDLMPFSGLYWNRSKNYDDIYIASLSNDIYEKETVDGIQNWAMRSNRHLWLGLNKNIKDFFHGDEVDYCIAGDWNFDVETRTRTPIGNAEYQMKYRFPICSFESYEVSKYNEMLNEIILDCLYCMPFSWNHFIFTTIPAVKEKQDRLAWDLAKRAAETMGVSFRGVTLLQDKPQMKEQLVENKIKIWKNIFCCQNQNLLVPQAFYEKNICIIDDLYQSGASIWCFAEFLKKRYNAKTIVAVTAVKALKDGGNK